MENQRALVIVEPEDLEQVRLIAKSQGVSVQALARRGEPVTTVTLVLLGGSAAVSSAVALIDRRKGGQVIDLRDGAPKTMYRSHDVLFGLVIVLASDGAVVVEVHEPKGMFGEVVAALATVISELGSAGIDAIAQTAATLVADRADVTKKPLKG